MSRPTGIGRYTASLMSALADFAPDVEIHHLRHAPLDAVRPRALRRAMYLAWLASGVPGYRQRRSLDLVHFTNFHVPPRKPRGLCFAATIHDLVPFRVPDTKSRRYSAYLRRSISQALRVADLVFADSYAARDEIAAEFGANGESIRVVYVAPAIAPLPPDVARAQVERAWPTLAAPFVLFVGALERRKNLVELVRAVAQLPPRFQELQLVLVGRPGTGYGAIADAVSLANERRQVVHVLTGCSDEDLRALYSACEAFVFPSLYEGYGIPLLEAMRCGAPIVASDIPTSVELTDGAAVIVPPTAAGIGDGLVRVLESDALRTSLSDRGRSRVALFTPEHTARQLLEAYDTVIGGTR
jgi:glycosyltransferase involved in cell wall biosynthesis